MDLQRRPEAGEYADYYARYVKLVPDGDIIDVLRGQLANTIDLLAGVSGSVADHRYAPGKWSTKEVLGHVVDVEWVFSYRALRFARGDRTELPGIDQDALVAGSNHGERTIRDILDEFQHLRMASICLFESFNDEVLRREGTASGCRFTVRSVPYIVAGHERHHMNVLRERYLTTP